MKKYIFLNCDWKSLCIHHPIWYGIAIVGSWYMERCWNIFKWSFPSCIEFVCTVASGDLLTLRFIVIITSVCVIMGLRSVLAQPAGRDILLHRTNMQVKYFGNVFRTKNFEWCIFNIFIRFIFHAPTHPLIEKSRASRWYLFELLIKIIITK